MKYRTKAYIPVLPPLHVPLPRLPRTTMSLDISQNTLLEHNIDVYIHSCQALCLG